MEFAVKVREKTENCVIVEFSIKDVEGVLRGIISNAANLETNEEMPLTSLFSIFKEFNESIGGTPGILSD